MNQKTKYMKMKQNSNNIKNIVATTSKTSKITW